MEDFSSNNAHSNKGMRPIALVSQLLPLVATMHHIDELLAWFANTMVAHFGVVSAQVWAMQAYSSEMIRSRPRASASQHPFQSSLVLESAEVRVIVERMLHDKRGLSPVPVTTMFSQYQAKSLAQQDCLYWSTYFFSKDVLLPPPQKHPERGEIATPVKMLFSFFTPIPLQSAETRAIIFLLEQSFRIAMSHGLLSKASANPKKETQSMLNNLIPERVEDTKIEQGENPFNNAVVISERISRQMYNLIDGKKNIEELMILMHVNRKEMIAMLQPLLAKGYIKLCNTEGDALDLSSLSQLF